MELTVSPLAPASYPETPAIGGVRLATAEAGIKYRNRTDVLLAVFDEGTEVAGVFTRSKCPSAPVEWCRDILAGGSARALLVNSGNANAFTGTKGRESTRMSAEAAAKVAGCRPDEVFLASTGVIGEPLDASKFDAVLGDMAGRAEPGRFLDAAKAIMTTDTYPKVAVRRIKLDGETVSIVGIAKGSGMIAPDMATMLSFIFTDAPVAAGVLQDVLSRAVRKTFNAVTVDSDTSTSDTVLAFATGKAKGVARIAEVSGKRVARFRRAFVQVLRELAHHVVKDGEGATKFVSITVEGATSKRSARRIALSIANSPLVKTAVAGEDANWGRIVMAVGKAGEPAERDKLAIWFGDVRVAVDGERDPDYSEAAASAVMKKPEIAVRVDLGLGKGRDTVWTCDLTKAYVAINGDYRS
ncbi:MAG: bifunctional ornithine acetyltransferase/N-acetylglutamate synthase [Hyphomicrobiales bacterium]|nr:MAG: bifunctional ornithine acetyltransferase/N-acetylglutamate synthase [Hyphomicrobiales bacterium]